VNVGDVDIHTVIRFKKEKLNGADYGYNRLAIGYQCLHTYVRVPPHQKDFFDATLGQNSDDLDSGPFGHRYDLVSEVVFLMIDEGPFSLGSIGTTDGGEATGGESGGDGDNCDTTGEAGGGAGGTSGGSEGTIAGFPEGAGDGDIAKEGEAMVGKGIGYHFGSGRGSKVGKYVDCSSFVWHALRRAGYHPSGATTKTIFKWASQCGKCWHLTSSNRKEMFAKAKRGDIFWSLGGKSGKDPKGHMGIVDTDGLSKIVHANSSGHGPNIRSTAGWYSRNINYLCRVTSCK
jgi:hypothetical protein